MLRIVLSDIRGREKRMDETVSLSIISSWDAPADSLRAVFPVRGCIREYTDISVFLGNELFFSGIVDEQNEETGEKGHFLEIRARSREAVLLDNEARPETLCLADGELIFERHFRELGFSGIKGGKLPCGGELVISKGMSEWDVLEEYCNKFTGTRPVIHNDGMIDVSGGNNSALIMLSPDKIEYVKKCLRRSGVISEIFARTYNAGGYEMRLTGNLAERKKIRRRRFVNVFETKGRSVGAARELITRSEKAYESRIIGYRELLSCRPGDRIRIRGEKNDLRIKEVHLSVDAKGCRTRIYAEVES